MGFSLTDRHSLTLIVSIRKVNRGNKKSTTKLFLINEECCLSSFFRPTMNTDLTRWWNKWNVKLGSGTLEFNYLSSLRYETTVMLWCIRSGRSAAAFNQLLLCILAHGYSEILPRSWEHKWELWDGLQDGRLERLSVQVRSEEISSPHSCSIITPDFLLS